MKPAGYPDLHAHIAALERNGLLIRVQRPINKDTEMHALVRWQFRGGIPEAQRKAFLFENVIRQHPAAAMISRWPWEYSASNREIYSVGIGCSVRQDQTKMGPMRNSIRWRRCSSSLLAARKSSPRARHCVSPAMGWMACRFPSRPRASTMRPMRPARCSFRRTRIPDSRISATTAQWSKARPGSDESGDRKLNQGIHEHWLKYKARGERMPVALLLGAPPAVTFAAGPQAAEASR